MNWAISKQLKLNNGALYAFLSYGRVTTENIEAYLLGQFSNSEQAYVEILRLSEDECEAILLLCPNCGQIATVCSCPSLFRHEYDFIMYFGVRL